VRSHIEGGAVIANPPDETVAGIATVTVFAVGFQRVGAGLDIEKVRPARADRLPLAALNEDMPRALYFLDEQLLFETEGDARGNPRLIAGHGEVPGSTGAAGSGSTVAQPLPASARTPATMATRRKVPNWETLGMSRSSDLLLGDATTAPAR